MPSPSLTKYKRGLVAIFAAAIVCGGASSAAAFEKINQNFFGVAIKGYDAVAYHTESRAVKGKKKFSHEWNNAKWYFSSAENRDLFAENPERYAPQYGGY